MIWPFRARREEAPLRELVPAGFVDVHCHVLPGLDDGARSDAEADALLDGLAALGYARVAATPHFHHSGFETPTPARIAQLAEEWNARRRGAPSIDAGAEIAFDERFLPSLEAGRLPRLGAGDAYLVELPAVPGSLSRGFEELVFKLAARGTALVIAHAERIPDLQRSATALEAVRRAGAIVQVDLTSLSGRHGRTARSCGWRLVENGLADVVASDAHSPADLTAVEEALRGLAAFAPEELARLASENPARLLEGDFDRVVRNA